MRGRKRQIKKNLKNQGYKESVGILLNPDGTIGTLKYWEGPPQVYISELLIDEFAKWVREPQPDERQEET